MSDTKLSDEQWALIEPFLPPQPMLGRRQRLDREVLNSHNYRLKTSCRYRNIPRTQGYAPSTTHDWICRWITVHSLGRGGCPCYKEGEFDRLWQQLLTLVDAQGQLDLGKGSLDGGFVAAKKGVKLSLGATRVKAQR